MPSWQSKVFRRGFETGRRQLYGDLTDMPALRARMDKLSAPLARWTDLAWEPVEGTPIQVHSKLRASGSTDHALKARTTVEPAKPQTDAPVPAEWVFPKGSSAQRTVVYLHGGGYCVGSIVTHRVLAGEVARAAQARALVIDYRLAPEDPFPAAVEDSLAAYEWLLAQGTEPGQVVLAGDSAGGGLVISTLVALRDKGLPLPAAGVCLSPWTDLSLSGESIAGNAKSGVALTAEMLRTFAVHYLGEGDPCSPLASPLYADPSGLPPLLVQVGSHEILLDDARRLAERAQAAGVEVVLDVWEEMVHVWQAYAVFLPEAREAIARIGEFVVEHMRE